MALFNQYSFPAVYVRSLCWRGDELVDWVGGGRAFARDGNGLVLKDWQVLREINRSYYCANAYEYPVALFHGPDGRLLLAHCPQSYDRLDLEDAETGRPLTASVIREPADYFHSRLVASPGGKRLLSAGWIWQPYDILAGFEVARALADPRELDRRGTLPIFSRDGFIVDEGSACWLDDDRIVVAAADHEEEDLPEEAHASEGRPGLRARGLVVYDLAAGKFLQSHPLTEPLGTILPIGRHHVLSLYRHPKLIELATGQVIHAWPELPSGFQKSARQG